MRDTRLSIIDWVYLVLSQVLGPEPIFGSFIRSLHISGSGVVLVETRVKWVYFFVFILLPYTKYSTSMGEYLKYTFYKEILHGICLNSKIFA